MGEDKPSTAAAPGSARARGKAKPPRRQRPAPLGHGERQSLHGGSAVLRDGTGRAGPPRRQRPAPLGHGEATLLIAPSASSTVSSGCVLCWSSPAFAPCVKQKTVERKRVYRGGKAAPSEAVFHQRFGFRDDPSSSCNMFSSAPATTESGEPA